jgi:uncharacterized phiE125 gp8 family phage protein
MQVRVITPPEPIVTWAEAKAHLRLDSDFEQDLVEGYIAAATAWIDGPEGWLGRSIGVQTLELTDCAFGNDALPYGPIVSIESIHYKDAPGLEQELPDTDYRLLLNGSIYAQAWPAVGSDPEAVRVRYVAGYASVPSPIKQAILLLIGQWFVTRQAVNVGNIVNEMPFAVEALLAPYRVWR